MSLEFNSNEDVDALLESVERHKAAVQREFDKAQRAELAAIATVALEMAAAQVQGKVREGEFAEDVESSVDVALKQSTASLESLLSKEQKKMHKKRQERREMFLEHDPGYVAPLPHAAMEKEWDNDEEEEEEEEDGANRKKQQPKAKLSREEYLQQAADLDNSGDKEEALFAMDEAIKLGSDFESCFKRGMLHLHFGNHDEASDDFTRCLSFRPNDIDSLVERGKIRSKWLMDYEGACEDLEIVLEKDPKHEVAFSEYRRALRFHGKPRTTANTINNNNNNNNKASNKGGAAENSNSSKPGNFRHHHRYGEEDEDDTQQAKKGDGKAVEELQIEREFWASVTNEKNTRKHE